jgi:hypothetical protein
MDWSKILATGTFRRLVVGAAASGVAVANKKLGLDLDATEVGELLLLAATYIVASNMAEVKKKGIEAAAAVKTDADAAAVLGSSKPPEAP